MPPKIRHLFTKEQWDARKKEMAKIRTDRFKAKHPNHNKEYYNKHQDKLLAYSIDYNKTHVEEIKTYRKENQEKIKLKDQKYYKSPPGLKSSRTNMWRQNGITFGNMDKDEFYEYFINTPKCDSCYKEFDEINWNNKRMLDHIDIDIDCNIRGVICHECNSQDNWTYRMKDDSIYQNYLEQCINDNT